MRGLLQTANRKNYSAVLSSPRCGGYSRISDSLDVSDIFLPRVAGVTLAVLDPLI